MFTIVRLDVTSVVSTCTTIEQRKLFRGIIYLIKFDWLHKNNLIILRRFTSHYYQSVSLFISKT